MHGAIDAITLCDVLENLAELVLGGCGELVGVASQLRILSIPRSFKLRAKAGHHGRSVVDVATLDISHGLINQRLEMCGRPLFQQNR